MEMNKTGNMECSIVLINFNFNLLLRGDDLKDYTTLSILAYL